MKIFLSPAKRLDESPNTFYKETTSPVFIEKATTIMKVLQKKSPKKLMEMQKISEELAGLNYERNQQWEANPKEGLQAGLMFDGEVYRGLRDEKFTDKEIKYLQKNLFILSGLYGVLRLTDEVMPYRLEMGTDIKIGQKNNLYEFWQKTITNYINDVTEKDEILLDLSSKEYMKVLDKKKLNGKIMNVKFMDMHQGKLKQITVYFKQARGHMAHFCATNKVKNLNDLKQFNEMEYVYADRLSDENTLIFTR